MDVGFHELDRAMRTPLLAGGVYLVPHCLSDDTSWDGCVDTKTMRWYVRLCASREGLPLGVVAWTGSARNAHVTLILLDVGQCWVMDPTYVPVSNPVVMNFVESYGATHTYWVSSQHNHHGGCVTRMFAYANALATQGSMTKFIAHYIQPATNLGSYVCTVQLSQDTIEDAPEEATPFARSLFPIGTNFVLVRCCCAAIE
jgi:hypothetical protein